MIRAIVTLLVLGFVGMTVLGLLFGLVAPLPDAEGDPATTRRVVPRMAFREPAPDRWRTSIPSL